MKPINSYFGYDEPNYTYMQNGRKLVGELAGLSRAPVYIRTHHMLVTGDAAPSMKWGSTNAYTEDASGRAVYDWTVVDRIIETYLHAGAKPFVEIGFMPEALSSHPQPYVLHWPKSDGVGWSYPPKDYAKWGELVYQWVRHSVEKYGAAEVATWYWELWNEPDIFYWRGTPEEYNRLYDYTADAVKRALPKARVGGPATTGPAGAKAAAYLRQFLEHCARGRNEATGKTGAPLDFISYHAKGQPEVVGGQVRMGLGKELSDVARGFEIVTSFPEFRNLPIVLSEADPEGCAACSVHTHPQNAYRNGTLYPAYTAAALKGILELAGRDSANIEGMMTWAFEFEGQPYFDGLRTLATNGIDKPVLNVFRMAALMRGDRVKTESSGRTPLDKMLAEGAGGDPDVDALAVRSDRGISVLTWNYHDDDVPAAEAKVLLEISGVPSTATRVQVRHYRIDENHSNAWTVWKALGSPEHPTQDQYTRLETAGQLQLADSPRRMDVRGGVIKLEFSLPRQGVSLMELSW